MQSIRYFVAIPSKGGMPLIESLSQSIPEVQKNVVSMFNQVARQHNLPDNNTWEILKDNVHIVEAYLNYALQPIEVPDYTMKGKYLKKAKKDDNSSTAVNSADSGTQDS